MHFKGTKKTLPEIARELNVDAVVEGAVLRSGNRVRVTANLLHAPTDRHLWSNSYESELQDVLVLQGEVARAIAEEVRIKLRPEEQLRLTRTRPINPDAYEAFLKGRHYRGQLSPEGQLKCVEYYQQAIRKEPTYALAYAQMGHCYNFLAHLEYPPARENLQRGSAAARKALELDDAVAEAHAALAEKKFFFDWDWSGGKAGFRRAMEIDPGSVEPVVHYAESLHALGRYDEAIELMERARQLDPLSPMAIKLLGDALYNAHHDARAIDLYRRFLEVEPNDIDAHFGLGTVYEALGRYDEAGALYLKARSLRGDSPERAQAFQRAFRAGGIRGYWKDELAETKETSKRQHVPPCYLASLYVRVGEKETALEWLEKAYQQRSPMLVWLKADRVWDPLRSDPRFQALLRRMNFP